jgi:hypothetical protein
MKESLTKNLFLICFFSFVFVPGCAEHSISSNSHSLDKFISSIKSVTYYCPLEENRGHIWTHFDLEKFEKAVIGIKAMGANTVWLVLPWHDFQPVALPEPEWNYQALDNLDKAIGIANKYDMRVILPLCYLGVGWSPEGIDALQWTVDEKMYGAFREYAKQFVRRLLTHKNLVFLLYGEDGYPSPVKIGERQELVNHFKQWCWNNNSDINYWNERWQTNFTWDTFEPFPKEPDSKNRWLDHFKWCVQIIRDSHGKLAVELRDVIGNKALLGYHDDIGISKDWAGGDSPVPDENPYQFLSFAHYCSPSFYNSQNEYLEETTAIISRFRARYPDMPLAMLETGFCESMATSRINQAYVVSTLAKIAKKEKIGINIWAWQDFTYGSDSCQQTFGLTDVNGNKKPVYFSIRKVWKNYP